MRITPVRKTRIKGSALLNSNDAHANQKTGFIQPLTAIATLVTGESTKKLVMLCQCMYTQGNKKESTFQAMVEGAIEAVGHLSY